jgi:hypothetical protein
LTVITINSQGNPTRDALTLVKRASELRGLTFGNGIDTLLSEGLVSNTFNFLYGHLADSWMNVLCGNFVRIFKSKALFVDAANCFDPYLIVDRCAPKKSEAMLRKFLEKIIIVRAFSCYQLRAVVMKQIEQKYFEQWEDIHAVFVTGIDAVFNEEDNPADEIDALQLLMANSLQKTATQKRARRPLFVVSSSKTFVKHFVEKSDTSIKLYQEKGGKEMAMLSKHWTQQFAATEL